MATKRIPDLTEANTLEAGNMLMVGKQAADYAADVSKFLIWDTDTGEIQPVKIGANGTGPGGEGRALYVDNT